MPPRKRRVIHKANSTEIDSTTSPESTINKKEETKTRCAEMIKLIRDAKEAKHKEIKNRIDLILLTSPQDFLEMSMVGVDSKEEFYSRIQTVLKEVQQRKENVVATASRRKTRSLENREPLATAPPIDKANSLDSEKSINDTASDESHDQFFSGNGMSTVKRRRSRSFGGGPLERHTRIAPRSSSATGRIDQFQTPKNCELGLRLMSHRKFTVRKPIRNQGESAVNVKRFMRAGEEAISVTGSPLYVQGGSSVTEPQVMIPLPGGVVVNIEPNKILNFKTQKQPIDPQIRMQLKAIHDKLANFF